MVKESTDIQNQELDDLFERYRKAPDSYAFVLLADACRKMGRFEEALDVCDNGVQKHPDYASGHVVRGKCLYDLDRYGDAIDAFEEVLRIDQNNLVALKFLGMIDAENGNFESARRRFERILQLDPANKEIKQALRIVDEKDEAGEAEATEEVDEEVQDLDVEDAIEDDVAPPGEMLEASDELASVTLADIFASQGYADKALAIYREVLAQQPGNAAVRAKIAELTGEAPPEIKPVEPITPTKTPRTQASESVASAPESPAEAAHAAPEPNVVEDDSMEDTPVVIMGPPPESRTDTESVGVDGEFEATGEPDEDALVEDDTMIGETIELSHDARADHEPSPPPRPVMHDDRTGPIAVDEDDLESEVNQVIELGAGPEDTVGQSADVTAEASEATAPVVELPYDGGDPSVDADDASFEEFDESKPIKRQSPPRKKKAARKTKPKEDDTSSQRHRRAINEKENFNYFKRWLDRMQD